MPYCLALVSQDSLRFTVDFAPVVFQHKSRQSQCQEPKLSVDVKLYSIFVCSSPRSQDFFTVTRVLKSLLLETCCHKVRLIVSSVMKYAEFFILKGK